MLRRGELWLVLLVSLGIVGAALVGQWTAPSRSLVDHRRSAMLDGPAGAKGLAEVLERLGLEVELHQRPLFEDSSFTSVGDILLLFDVPYPLTNVEIRAVRNAVASGNALFLAGTNGVELCFGYRMEFTEKSDSNTTLVHPRGIDSLPPVDYFIERVPGDSIYGGEESVEDCPLLFATEVDTLLTTVDGEAAALRLRFRQGGSVTLLGDSWLLSNETMKETDVGLLVVAWILDSDPRTVVIDEFHQGFRDTGSIFAAAWTWALASPVGWTILQLSAVALLILACSSVRFGPALSAVERKRRSAMEHLDALAVGLERADGRSTAVELFAGGLRRRLTRAGTSPVSGERIRDWLVRLSFAVHTPGARRDVKRLAWLVREPGSDDDVLDAAIAAEDVWEALGRRNRPN